MVRGHSLNTLRQSSPLFGNHKFMSLFCEALKYSRVLNLHLNNSSINDSSLLLLASAICDMRTELTILHIYNNRYTEHGLIELFKCFNYWKILRQWTWFNLFWMVKISQRYTGNIFNSLTFCEAISVVIIPFSRLNITKDGYVSLEYAQSYKAIVA